MLGAREVLAAADQFLNVFHVQRVVRDHPEKQGIGDRDDGAGCDETDQALLVSKEVIRVAEHQHHVQDAHFLDPEDTGAHEPGKDEQARAGAEYCPVQDNEGCGDGDAEQWVRPDCAGEESVQG